MAVQVQLFPINLATTQVQFRPRHQAKLYLRLSICSGSPSATSTDQPSHNPIVIPSEAPSKTLSLSNRPSSNPSDSPSASGGPSTTFSNQPSHNPSVIPVNWATLHLPLTVQVQLFPINLAITQVLFRPRHQAKLYLHPTDLAVIWATLRLRHRAKLNLRPTDLAVIRATYICQWQSKYNFFQST